MTDYSRMNERGVVTIQVNAASLRAYRHFKLARNALAGAAAVAAWVAASVGFNSIIVTLAATGATTEIPLWSGLFRSLYCCLFC